MGCEGGEVGGVGGDDGVGEVEGEGHEVGVDNVRCLGLAEQVAHNEGVIVSEFVNLDGSQQLGEPGLSASVAPHLGDDRGGRA